MERKKENISFDDLIANRESRYQPLRFLNTLIKKHLFDSEYIEIGRQKKYFNIQKPCNL